MYRNEVSSGIRLGSIVGGDASIEVGIDDDGWTSKVRRKCADRQLRQYRLRRPHGNNLRPRHQNHHCVACVERGLPRGEVTGVG